MGSDLQNRGVTPPEGLRQVVHLLGEEAGVFPDRENAQVKHHSRVQHELTGPLVVLELDGVDDDAGREVDSHASQ